MDFDAHIRREQDAADRAAREANASDALQSAAEAEARLAVEQFVRRAREVGLPTQRLVFDVPSSGDRVSDPKKSRINGWQIPGVLIGDDGRTYSPSAGWGMRWNMKVREMPPPAFVRGEPLGAVLARFLVENRTGE